MFQSMITHILPRLPYYLPLATLYLMGLILACVFFARHPKPAVLALLGCGLNLLIATLTTIAFAYLQASLDSGHLDGNQIGWGFTIVNAIETFFFFIAQTCLLAAIFMGRGQPEQQSAYFRH